MITLNICNKHYWLVILYFKQGLSKLAVLYSGYGALIANTAFLDVISIYIIFDIYNYIYIVLYIYI